MIAVGWRAGWRGGSSSAAASKSGTAMAYERAPDDRVEEPAHRRVLDVDRPHEQEPGIVVGALLAADREDLQLEHLVVLARRARARQQRLGRRPRSSGSMPARSAVAISCASRSRSASRFARRTLSAAYPEPASTAATSSVTTTVTRVPSVMERPSIAPRAI